MDNIAEKQGAIFAGKTAVVLGTILLVGYIVFAGLVGVDRAQRARLETINAPSVAGDHAEMMEKK